MGIGLLLLWLSVPAAMFVGMIVSLNLGERRARAAMTPEERRLNDEEARLLGHQW